jgi:DNA invertase Pin-like site-specific DNA recombinase
MLRPAMSKPRVYSYLRFSDPKQATGSSVDRQTEYARRWAAERGLQLDAALSMRDEGLSAYHQRHVTAGALGVFLAAISEGRIAAGSVLIVEGLDRLSRAEPILAQAQLSQIISAGITVVTASDGKEYNRERLKTQPMDLVYSLLVMIRAHEESDTKSKRVKAAVRRQCDGWVAGTFRGIIRNGKDPAWAQWTGTRFELVEEHANAVRYAIELFKLGEGGQRVTRALAEKGLKLTPDGSNASHFYKTIRLPALKGVKRIEADGEAYELHDYYPRLLSDAEWSELQHLATERHRRRGHGDIVGLITGLNLTYCGYCGQAVVAQNLMGRAKPDGSLADGHRRLLCCGYSHSTGCPVPGSSSVVPIESAILGYCSDQLNLTALLTGDGQEAALRSRLATLRAEIAHTEKQITRVTDAMLADDAPPAAFARKARDLEAQLDRQKADAQSTENELAAVARTEAPALAETWAALSTRALEMDKDARLQVRRLVADTFARITVYHASTDPHAEGQRPIEVKLTAKSGQSRTLQINRRTGAFTTAADYIPGS